MSNQVKPTKEQREQARERALALLAHSLTGEALYLCKADRDALTTLLAATTEPSEEELAEEAERYALAKDGAVEAGTSTLIHVEEAYIAGARREGRP